jgi:hypothetical protein
MPPTGVVSCPLGGAGSFPAIRPYNRWTGGCRLTTPSAPAGTAAGGVPRSEGSAMRSPVIPFAMTSRGVGAAVAAVLLGFAVAGCSPASPTPLPAQSVTPSTATSSVTPTPTDSQTPVPTPTDAPSSTPSATPSPAPTIALCPGSGLAARITTWQGGMGQRIADVELTNTGQGTCVVYALSRPQLVDGHGSVLIDGPAPGASAGLSLASGGVLRTQTSAGNYCGAAPVAPVSLAFVLAGGAGRVAATPLSPTDQSGLPPCNGGPGSAGTISMHPWAP